MRKIHKYKEMKCNKVVNCPCYESDGYTYRFDSIEFNLCKICNRKLRIQMVEQVILEQKLEEQSTGDKK